MSSARQFLDQKAIDSLFAAAGAEAAAPDAVPYSFLRPARIGAATLRRLETINAGAGSGLRRHLAQQLRMGVEVQVLSTESVLYSEFAASLGAPSATYLFSVGREGEGPGYLDWHLDLAFGVVDRLLGGPGAGARRSRGLTPIEQEILAPQSERVVALCGEAWKPLAFGPRVRGFESDLGAGEGGQGKILATLFDIRTDAFRGILTLGLPAAQVEPVLDAMHRPRRAQPGLSLLAGSAMLDGSDLRLASLTLTARWPAVLLNLQAIRGLAPGQVIDTTHALDTPVQLFLNGNRLMTAGVGELKGHVAVRVGDGPLKPLPDRMVFTNRGRVLMSTEPLTTVAGAAPGDAAGLAGSSRPTAFPLDALLEVPMPVIIEVGRTHLPLSEVLELQAGSVVSLDRLVGDPVDILVSDRKLAEGEVVVVGENLGVRITRVVAEANGAAGA